ncbi:glycine betaine ABC transporter substrate-binding protein [Planococcus halotolerans]|uniref:Glycine/betaine ABC transporter n=1 Tax=Planococcus halotolerans TaxID=2233542 RepID=A0A365KXF2_9BACL|nr:glycine betaine ABC transporter substrate-binding protein [Planococcus halotolerans]QHJ72138.1 glycine/betaine ABC transporter [Planococcus halotolerans]RAZ77846.1 glycine/betaine ABC transporter [Planococcus halotolerans]
MIKYKYLTGTAALSAALLVAGCGSDEGSAGGQSLGEELDYTITGIEPGAGLTGLAKDTLEEYDNLEGWELEESSTASMLTALDDAIDDEEPLIITGWTPHWMFSAYDLKFLEDPKETLGGPENIQTIAREGFEEDFPEAYKILDAFEWELEDLQSVMYAGQDMPFEEAGQNWIDENRETVDEWTANAEPVDDKKIELVSTPWDSERASASVLEIVLEEQGFDVTVTDVDPAVLFEAIATGGADASIAPWLPVTHGAFYEKHEENMLDLGPNLTGAQNGIAVPAYMDIDSIEDLEPKE